MRASTVSIGASCALFVIAACGQVIGEGADGGADADASSDGPVFVVPDASTFDVAPPPPPSKHDAGPPDAASPSEPCLDAGPDAYLWQTCPPPPPSYCIDQYAVVYGVTACGDAGACTYSPSVQDCLGGLCSGCTSDDAGHAGCNCIIPE